MENAVDALKMAGAVLMFIIALSVSIVSFSQVRQTADVILDYKDRETIYIDGNLYYEATGTERSVGVETIIPTIVRAYSEQYKIVFEGLGDIPIYTYKNGRGEAIERYSIDLDFDNDLINASDREQGYKTFLNAIIYGKDDDENFKTWYSASRNKNKWIELPSTSLYNRLKGKTITEYLGVYYISETAKDSTSTTNTTSTEEVPDANKIEKRIITYKITT